MHLDEDFNGWTHRLAHSAQSSDGNVLFGAPDVSAPWIRKRIKLHRRKAALHHARCRARVVLRSRSAIRPAIGVNANTVAARTAQEVVHGLAADLSGDVPQRLFQRA